MATLLYSCLFYSIQDWCWFILLLCLHSCASFSQMSGLVYTTWFWYKANPTYIKMKFYLVHYVYFRTIFFSCTCLCSLVPNDTSWFTQSTIYILKTLSLKYNEFSNLYAHTKWKFMHLQLWISFRGWGLMVPINRITNTRIFEINKSFSIFCYFLLRFWVIRHCKKNTWQNNI